MSNYKYALVVLMEMPDKENYRELLKFIKKDALLWDEEEKENDFSYFLGQMSYHNNSETTVNHFRGEIQEIYKGNDSQPNVMYMTHIFTAEDLVYFSDYSKQDIDEWLQSGHCCNIINNNELNQYILDTMQFVITRQTNKKLIEIPSFLINLNLIDAAFDRLDPASVAHYVSYEKDDSGFKLISA